MVKYKKIFIAGAGTAAWWNTGDEAILSSMLSDLRAKLPTSEFFVLSANPQGTLRGYHVEEVPIGDIEKLIAVAKNSDLFILGGGGLFYDYWGFNVNELLTTNHMGHGVYVDFALLATLLHKPLMIYAVGVGPLITETAHSFTKLVFDQAQQITVRDSESKDITTMLGISPDRVHITADPAFSTENIHLDLGRQLLQKAGLTSLSNPIIGVSVRSWRIGNDPGTDWEDAVAQSLDRFIEKYGATILFIPFHKKVEHVDDYGESVEIQNRMKHADRSFVFDDSCSLEEKVSLLRHCDLVLGMRLHSLVFAIRYGVPAIGLAYDPKVSHLFTSLHQSDYVLGLQDLNSEDLFFTMDKAYENRNLLRSLYTQQGTVLANLARENATFAVDLIEKGMPASSLISDQTVEAIKSLLVEQSLQLYKKEQVRKELVARTVQEELVITEKEQVISEKEQVISEKEQVISEKEQVISEKEQVISEKEQVISEKEQVISEKEQVITGLRQALTSITQSINQIHSSRSWQLVVIIQRIRMVIVPPGSRRARLLGTFFRRVLSWYRKYRPVVVPEVKGQPLIPDFIGRYISSPSETRVLLITRIFFGPMGNDMQFGGAERYLLELADIIHELGYEPVIIQLGNEYWMRYYGNQPVIGVQVGYDYDSFIPKLEKLVPRGALVIYSPFELASEKLQIPTIGISHGVYWDDEIYHHSHDELLSTINRLKAKVEIANTLVSVDTNTINWLRTVSPANSEKSVYIPNFVDLEQFTPPVGQKDTQRLTVLFPRRLVHQRGFWLVHAILPAILEKYPHVDFHFVGKGGPEEQQAISLIREKYPTRVFWYFLPPEEMHIAYQKADITLIPTTLSEGTSLSCLEALAMGNAVIATTVGGLPDLILNRYNGLLIEPTVDALQTALENLIDDGILRNALGKRGQEVAKSFSLGHWKEKWRDIIHSYLPNRSPNFNNYNPRFIVFPYSWGLPWHGVQQRPHHIAVQFSRCGFEIYWYTPEGRLVDPVPGVHLVSKIDELYVERPILFTYYPHSFLELGRFRNPIVIYDVLDDISIYEASGSDSQTANEGQEYHQKLLERADIVLASSRLLMEQVSQKRPDVIYLPNGVDTEHFHYDNHRMGSNIKSSQKPIVGYHGAVASWFDGDLVAKAAQLRPEYQFVIIGPVSDTRVDTLLRSQPNVKLFGSIPYEDLPPYIAQFDVGIMPFVLSKLTHAVRPLKIVEYLSMRKPVVSTPIQEILDWPGVLFAKDPQSFAEKIDMALKNGLQDKDLVEAFVMDSAWNKTIQPLLELLDKKWLRN